MRLTWYFLWNCSKISDHTFDARLSLSIDHPENRVRHREKFEIIDKISFYGALITDG